MSKPQLSEQMRRLLEVVRDAPAGADMEVEVARLVGIEPKQALRRLEKAADRQLIEYGVCIQKCWLTEAGKAALA